MSVISQLMGNEILDPFLSMVNKCPVLNAPTDWKETPEAHMFIVDLPGLKKDEVKVEVDGDGYLIISGERKVPEDKEAKGGEGKKGEGEGEGEKWHRVERFRGKFSRRFRLPRNAKREGIKACMEDGVLTVIVPKADEKKPEVKRVEIH
ncbi:18.1 kDa class I heat shock protein-like [Eucalyptus grandis]|uniref:18.1 kDa class I heat shock protein-like n=1 Tax=Eucalyptus grandis TaxID=71139 RepID=UPI00192EFCE4|nr:18.1 kDa class I heat shock protein-like [Eucalyptus grandis]